MSVKTIVTEMEKEQQAETESLNLFKSTQTIIQQALKKLGHNNEMYDLLKEPIRLLTVRIPVRMDDGSQNIYWLPVPT